MQAFSYVSPTKKEDVPVLLGKSWGEVEILAGGTDLLSLMKDDITTPKKLVNIKQVAGIQAISNENGGIAIGALVTLDHLSKAGDVKQRFPVLAMAAGEAASPQIRNLATVGGNLCQ